MDTFTALAEPTRRNILEMLADSGELPASAIYSRFQVSPPAISQHLKVLRDANLVRVERRAQQRIYFVNPEPMRELEKWVHQFAATMEDRYQKLDKVLNEQKKLLKNKQKREKR
jgi:DNA-binding transcriptional ArsR family regulator